MRSPRDRGNHASRTHQTARARLLSALATISVAACGPMPEGLPADREIGLRPNGDILAAGETVELADSVVGDVMAFGRTARFDGYVGGSVLSGAGDVQVTGRIDGSVRAAGGAVTVEADVGRNVTLAGGDVDLAETTRVHGNAYLAGGTVRVGGVVDGDVYVGGGDVTLAGTVEGDVRVEATTLRVSPDARVLGELRYRLDEAGEAEIASSADIGDMRRLEPRRREGPGFGFYLLRALAFVVTGLVIVALVPRPLVRAVDVVGRRPGASALVGLLAFPLVPVLAVAVGATVIGAPLAIIAMILYGVSLYLAPIVPALWIGREIMGADLAHRDGALKAMAVGGGLVAIAVVLPWVGFLARALAVCLGMGAVLMMIDERRRRPAGA